LGDFEILKCSKNNCEKKNQKISIVQSFKT
jgi:hypothetical protein